MRSHIAAIPQPNQRTADLRALTEARVAEAAPGLFSAEQLSELTQGRHREDCPASS